MDEGSVASEGRLICEQMFCSLGKCTIIKAQIGCTVLHLACEFALRFSTARSLFHTRGGPSSIPAGYS